MSKTAAKDGSDLTQAALALDAELRVFQQLVATALRHPLDSERGLERATRAATEAQESQARLGPLMHSLSAALSTAWAGNQTATDQLKARVEEIESRQGEVNALLARYATLGTEAGEISNAVQQLGAAMPAESDAQKKGLLAQLTTIDGRMERLVDDARGLAQAARTIGLEELSRHIDSLRQQVHAARNRVGFLSRQLLDEHPGSVN